MRRGPEAVVIERDAELTDRRRPASLRGYVAKDISVLTSTDTGSDSLVQQQFGEEVDVNTIMRRYGMTGSAPFGDETGVYGDFTGISDYDSAVERIRGAQERFMALPAEIREKFNNDPGELIRRANAMQEKELEAMFVEPVAPAPADSGTDPVA